ncbi:MAG: Esterase/lipase [Frankiales bacterium]|nr:Esterase/lipase [Frankiales bacterium]
MLDPRIAPALALLPPAPDRSLPAAERRRLIHDRWKAGAAAAVPTPLHEVTDVVVPGIGHDVPVRVYRPKAGLLPAVLYLHGGGWWLGGLTDTDEGARQRALLLDAVVVSVDYRLAPEHPFPAAVDDGWAVACWMFDNAEELGIDAERIVVAGGSAGANIAAALTLRARDEDRCPFVAQVLEVPATDLTLETSRGSIDEHPEGFVLSREDLVECTGWYVGDTDPRHPWISPLFGDLAGLPPAFVTTCEHDPVRDDGRAYAAKLNAAGVPTTHLEFEGQVHGSYDMAFLVPDVSARFREALVAFVGSAHS